MDPTQVLQSVLTIIQSGAGNLNGTNNTTSGSPQTLATSPDEASSSLAQLVIRFFGTTALIDWVKLMIMGAFLQASHRLAWVAWRNVVGYFWVSASFDWGLDAADWMMYWLSHKKVFHTARDVEVSAYFHGIDNARYDDLGENDKGEDLVSFNPSLERTYGTWYKGRYMTITRERSSDRITFSLRPRDTLKISILSRNTQLLRELITDARDLYKAASEHFINVYAAESTDNWKRVAIQEKRPRDSVVLDPGVLDLVLDDARDFLNSKKWYSDRGIPFRRGYLLYGPPGAGKTSMIHSLAGELRLDVYILSLTVSSLNDNNLKSLIGHLPKSCIVLIEDIDAAFTRGMKRDILDLEGRLAAEHASAAGGGDHDAGAKEKAAHEMLSNHGVTLSGLLNALDGIAAQEGRILFATTNDYSALDPALLRPGRLDLHVKFTLASRYQATELFKRFYTHDDAAAATSSEEDAAEQKGEKDSGYDSRSSRTSSVSESTSPSTLASIPEGASRVHVEMTRLTRANQLSPTKAAALANQFAEIIPPATFSMATLQGYLMAYKVRPYDAIEEAPAWVEKKLKEKAMQSVTKEGGVASE
ncbi:P-loop containing nucleoside triphosphate hydrolase protein [Fomes fomentarius]|nr:P-loop containing nucleoside triphosphate hydrolase protein [Fomes fomentarius]